ncbi:protein GFS12 isoform X2 [Punica granatum]|uniref:Protein GFS12 isoform X2 n=1 Tax=Punica granatum TaxID=22663 RepID=A0A6P8CKM6_PUNGR|nr:protein GFS12 isoform X2 [Punica granatum]
MEDRFCFECLERRIQSDYSGGLAFSYGLSDTPLPFGSAAVVQVAAFEGEASQFILKYLRSDQHSCLARYIDDCIESSSRINDMVPSEVKPEVCSSTTPQGQDGADPPPKQSESHFDCGKGKSSKGSISRCCSCDYLSTSSCLRTINALAPIAYAAPRCISMFEELASHFLSGSQEDLIIRSLSLLIEGKATGRDAVNFLRLVGVQSFGEIGVPCSIRHPNVAPVIGMLKSFDYINLVLPKTPYTLENILHFSPDVLLSEWDVRFLVYQLLSALAYLHDLGLAHGSISPSAIMITKSCWSWISVSEKLGSVSVNVECTPTQSTRSRIGCCMDDCVYQGLYADLKVSGSVDWHSEFKRWWSGELSNFEYLLVLNKLAGRRWGDHTFHPVMPWVIDFSTLPDENSDAGWRDLSKSKWRLAKGDEQLDFTYLTSEIPHHVSDECLSELAVCSYKARRLPLSVLRLAVRSVYEPNEYPSTMQRLYQWTPDECIPEFYFDPQIFNSIHSGMTNLAIPSWASSPEEFIKMHRDALESERVSRQLHMWIDVTFGYKMSGEAAVAAKNVMLPSSDPSLPRSIGRRQLFNRPHPIRRSHSSKFHGKTTVNLDDLNEVAFEKSLLSGTANLEELEQAYAFSEHARHLSPLYSFGSSAKSTNAFEESQGKSTNCAKSEPCVIQNFGRTFGVDSNNLLEYIEETDEDFMGYQELLLWRQKSNTSKQLSEDVAEDIFSIGCVLAELHLKRPLFDPTSLALYLEDGILPGSVEELPPLTRVLVEACVQRDWIRRPTAKSLLESPYFPASIKSSYLFVSPLQLLGQDSSRLHYLATFAKQGALKAMGPFAAEKSTSYCLPLLATPLSDIEAEWACTLLEEFIKSLKPSAVKTLIVPCIQKILQTTGYSRLKVSLLQDSFVREIWNRVGKYAYLEKLHPLVISNLHISPHKTSAGAASVLLIGSSEELGIPVTIHQTILPLIQCFGKGLSPDGIDVLIRIGGLLGDSFIVKQMLPLLKHMVHVCISVSCMNKSEPIQSWSGLALIDCLVTLDGLLAFLPGEVVVKELIQDRNCLHVIILMQTCLEVSVLQVAASMLLALCQRIGPDLTALHVLPQLKGLFDELAFSQETASGSGSSLGRSLKASKLKINEGPGIESRMDLVLLLYPSFATLLGIEKLRQCCATWLLLEQFLLRRHNWKWECTGESPRGSPENSVSKRSLVSQGVRNENSPAKMLLNGVGWSIPQSQGTRVSKNLSRKRYNKVDGSPIEGNAVMTNYMNREPWFWFPSPVNSWDGPEYLARVGSVKDELPWKIRACVLYSVRAHNGTLRSVAAYEDESTVFTAGICPGFKGTVQKWDLMRMNSMLGYYGHEEVVNDICVLSSSGRIASCDGTVHVWNSRTGKVISVFAEPTTDSTHFGSPILSPSSINADSANVLGSNSLSTGLLSSAFDGSLYTCMHHVEFSDKLIVGTGNGSIRFIDISQGQKLHSWRGELGDSGFPSLVSAISSCGSDNVLPDRASTSPSWIATGLSSGHCRLFDSRSGNVLASWKAHDGYVTKLAAPEPHLLVSSSLDKTLRVWDLRRNLPSQLSILRGHTDGVSGFSMWGQDVVSISRNKIGVSSPSKSVDEVIVPQNLHMNQQGTKNLSTLSSICILPFSRLFLVGTEDGYLRICC